MVYDAETYAKKFKVNGKHLHPLTIKKRASLGTLPSHTICHKLKGMWVFEVPDFPYHLKDSHDFMFRPKRGSQSQPGYSDQPSPDQ